MKILILSQSRSGSTTLYDAIIKKLHINSFFEPFHPSKTDDVCSSELKIIKIADSLLVKIIDNHFYRMPSLSDYKNLTKHFDKVIGLTRESEIDNANSYYTATKTGEWMNYLYKIDDIEINSEEYNQILQNSIKNKKQILSFDIFQVTYEGLYIRKDQWNSLEEYLGFLIKDEIFYSKKKEQ